jgi:hypothetical protein
MAACLQFGVLVDGAGGQPDSTFDHSCPTAYGFEDTTPAARQGEAFPVSYTDVANSSNSGNMYIRVKECTCNDTVNMCTDPATGEKTGVISDFEALQEVGKVSCVGASNVVNTFFTDDYLVKRKATVAAFLNASAAGRTPTPAPTTTPTPAPTMPPCTSKSDWWSDEQCAAKCNDSTDCHRKCGSRCNPGCQCNPTSTPTPELGEAVRTSTEDITPAAFGSIDAGVWVSDGTDVFDDIPTMANESSMTHPTNTWVAQLHELLEAAANEIGQLKARICTLGSWPLIPSSDETQAPPEVGITVEYPPVVNVTWPPYNRTHNLCYSNGFTGRISEGNLLYTSQIYNSAGAKHGILWCVQYSTRCP